MHGSAILPPRIATRVVSGCSPKLNVNSAHCLFKIELFIFFVLSYADITPRGEAPVVFPQLLVRDKLHQALYIPQLSVREMFVQPQRMAVKISYEFELLDRQSARFVERFRIAG